MRWLRRSRLICRSRDQLSAFRNVFFSVMVDRRRRIELNGEWVFWFYVHAIVSISARSNLFYDFRRFNLFAIDLFSLTMTYSCGVSSLTWRFLYHVFRSLNQWIPALIQI